MKLNYDLFTALPLPVVIKSCDNTETNFNTVIIRTQSQTISGLPIIVRDRVVSRKS